MTLLPIMEIRSRTLAKHKRKILSQCPKDANPEKLKRLEDLCEVQYQTAQVIQRMRDQGKDCLLSKSLKQEAEKEMESLISELKADSKKAFDSAIRSSKTDKAGAAFVPTPPAIRTSNRFAVLANEIPDQDPTPAVEERFMPKQTYIPPLILDKVKDWKKFNIGLKQLHLEGTVRAKITRERTQLILTKEADIPAVKDYCKKEEIEFYTHKKNQEKEIRVVIKGLPVDFETSDIKEELLEQNIEPQSVSQFRTRRNVKLPIFLVVLQKKAKNLEIKKLNSICNVIVHIENLRRSKRPVQCRNCQMIGHTSQTCYRKSRCVKCDGIHLTASCTNAIDTGAPAVCTNCGGAHPANYSGCPAFKKAQHKPTKPKVFTASKDQGPKPPQFPNLQKYNYTKKPAENQPEKEKEETPAKSIQEQIKKAKSIDEILPILNMLQSCIGLCYQAIAQLR